MTAGLDRVLQALQHVTAGPWPLRHEPCGRIFGHVAQTAYGPLLVLHTWRKLTADEMRDLIPEDDREQWDLLAVDPVALTEYARGSGHLKVPEHELHLLDWEDAAAVWVAHCRKCNVDISVSATELRTRLPGSSSRP